MVSLQLMMKRLREFYIHANWQILKFQRMFLSVVSHDGIIAQTTDPKLTTVEQHGKEGWRKCNQFIN